MEGLKQRLETEGKDITYKREYEYIANFAAHAEWLLLHKNTAKFEAEYLTPQGRIVGIRRGNSADLAPDHIKVETYFTGTHIDLS